MVLTHDFIRTIIKSARVDIILYIHPTIYHLLNIIYLIYKTLCNTYAFPFLYYYVNYIYNVMTIPFYKKISRWHLKIYSGANYILRIFNWLGILKVLLYVLWFE